jgi:hypothetical protein
MNLGSPLGLYVCCALFSSLLLASLLGVVGHYHGRERVYRKDMDIMQAWVGNRRESAPSNSPPESIADTWEREKEKRICGDDRCRLFIYSWWASPLMGMMAHRFPPADRLRSVVTRNGLRSTRRRHPRPISCHHRPLRRGQKRRGRLPGTSHVPFRRCLSYAGFHPTGERPLKCDRTQGLRV